MRPECEQAINAAADRKLTKAELDGIELRLKSAMKDMVRSDPKAFYGMSQHQQMVEAAKIAKQQMLDQVVVAHESSIREASKKARMINDLASVKPGLKGQVHYLKLQIDNIEMRVQAKMKEFFSLVDQNTVDTGKFFGMFHAPEKTKDIAAALYGESTASPEGQAAAKSLNGMLDTLVDQFHRKGMPLHELEDWRMPQPQEPHKVAGAGKETWVENHMEWVDRDKYINADGSKMNDDQLQHLLEQSYDSISTDGANKRADGVGQAGSPLVGSNKNAPRQLFYKNSEAWMESMQKYGRSTNMYDLMAQHVRGLSKDIVVSDMFGRDAEANMQQMMAIAYKNDLGVNFVEKNIKKLDGYRNSVQRMWDATIHPDRPGNEYWSNIGTQVRGLMGSSQLGSLFGALPDLAGMKMAAEYNGLPAIRMFRNFVDNLTMGPEKAAFLHRAGIWMDGFQHAANRSAVDEFRNGWGTFLNETTHRLMGLNAFDRGMRAGNSLTVMDVLGDFTRRLKLHEADGETRMLQDRGVTQDHWGVWQLAKPEQWRGNETLLTPDSIRNIPDQALDPLVQQRVAARSEILKAEIEKRNASSEKEAIWLAERGDRIRQAKEKTDAFMEELRNRRQTKVGDAAELENVRALVLSNMLRQLEVNHDFLAAHAAQGTHGRVVDMLNSAQDGGHIEGAKGLETKSNNLVQDFGRAINQGGEGLGNTQAKIAATIKEGQARIKELEKTLDLKTDAREKANAERFQEKVAELEKASKEWGDRVERRQDYIDAFNNKLGKVLTEERANLRGEALEKLMEVVQVQEQFGARGAANSSASDKVAMGIDSAKDAGTVMGEIKRFALQFKSVPIGMFRAHWEAGSNLPNASLKDLGNIMGSKQAYLAKFVAYSTMTGALAIELKAMANGQNPRNMSMDTTEGKKFWMEALAAGGGFGMYGDLFANGQTAQGSGVESLMGPGIGAGWNLVKEARAASEAAQTGETQHPFALGATRFIRKNATPLANLWYTKAAFNRLVYDQMQDHLAPGSSAKQQHRMMQRGASYWWAPGTTSPQSAPDIGKAWEPR